MPGSPDFPFDVFLSHNARDKPRVRKLAERLKAAGVRVWFDEWIIQAGDIIALNVDEGLEQSRVLLLCISPAALASGWVGLERSTAVHRDPANAGRRFIPLLLGDCALPDTLRRYKYVDFRDESDAAFAEVLATCRPETESVLPPTQLPGNSRLQSPIVIEATGPRLKIVVSSNTSDLPKHREQVTGAINRMGHTALVMEHGTAEWQTNAIKSSLEMIDESQVYIGIFGQCYGHILDDLAANPDRLSIAELEYRQSAKLGRPALLFLAKQTHPFSIDQIDVDPEKRAKLESLKSELQASEICEFFDSPEELREKVFISLQRLQVLLAKPSAVIVPGDFEMPAPPELLAVPQYTLTGTFIGRSSELTSLDAWAKSRESIMVVEGIGGLGKSAVTWEWMTTRAEAAIPGLTGRIWWSFYEHGTSLVTFVRFALAYVSGQNPETLLKGWSHYQRGEQLLRELSRRPYLLVLDGFERVLAAYHQMDKELISDHQVEEHRRECIHPPDGELLIQLLRCQPSKVLINTRLFPDDLLDRGSRRPAAGVARHILDGLSPADAFDLVQHAGVTGTEAAILAFAEQFGRHSLLLKVVCGLVADYRRRPLDFDAWHADPTAGGGLRLAELDLKQRRTHILHFALAGINLSIRTLLCRIAIVTASVTYDTLEILNPFQPPRPPEREKWEAHHQSREYLEGLKKLDAALQELEDRGLLQWDRQSNRYDMHPIVRAHAAEMLDSADRTATFQTVHDHFASLPPDNLAEATELTHVARSLEIYRCLIGAGRNDEAARYVDALVVSLLFHIGAFATIVELLTPLFPQGFYEPPVIRGRLLASRLLGILAISVSYTGGDEEALNLSTKVLQMDIDLRAWSSLVTALRNMGCYLYELDRRAEATEACELARLIAEAVEDRDGLTSGLYVDAANSVHQGRYSDAEDALVRFHQPPLFHVALYRPGDAEELMCRAKFEQGLLTAADWQEGFDLTVRHRNLHSQYGFKALWAQAELAAGQPASALEAVDEALQIVNRIGTPRPQYHDLRAWALVCLGREAEARTELEKGKGRLFAAEAWLALGERDRARVCALDGYRWAWGEGPPHIEFYHLSRCREVLRRLNEPAPTLPSFNPATRHPVPFEKEIRAELPKMKPMRNLRFVTGTNQGQQAWWFVAVSPEKLSDYKTAVNTEFINFEEYGQVIESGWGKGPPESVRRRIEDETGELYF